MNAVLESMEVHFRRYKRLGEAAMEQLSSDELVAPAADGANSVATLAWHMGGNLASRFTDFVTTDGEKPWRHRDDEFAARTPTREEITAHWDRGWDVLFTALAALTDADLARDVTIRSRPLTVLAALHRSLTHAAYHVGQIVLVARVLRGADWQWLSIPPGQSAAHFRAPPE